MQLRPPTVVTKLQVLFLMFQNKAGSQMASRFSFVPMRPACDGLFLFPLGV
jgi:hypothetical protein